jgi:hypothetical protein
MVTLHGIALIAELIAAAWLAIALAGFAKWRAAPWLEASRHSFGGSGRHSCWDAD